LTKAVASTGSSITRPFLGKRNDLSLGTYPEVSLDDARTIRDEYKNSSSRALIQQWSGLKPSLRNRKKQKIPFVLLRSMAI
jgi:hypothetical protein